MSRQLLFPGWNFDERSAHPVPVLGREGRHDLLGVGTNEIGEHGVGERVSDPVPLHHLLVGERAGVENWHRETMAQ